MLRGVATNLIEYIQENSYCKYSFWIRTETRNTNALQYRLLFQDFWNKNKHLTHIPNEKFEPLSLECDLNITPLKRSKNR